MPPLRRPGPKARAASSVSSELRRPPRQRARAPRPDGVRRASWNLEKDRTRGAARRLGGIARAETIEPGGETGRECGVVKDCGLDTDTVGAAQERSKHPAPWTPLAWLAGGLLRASDR